MPDLRTGSSSSNDILVQLGGIRTNDADGCAWLPLLTSRVQPYGQPGPTFTPTALRCLDTALSGVRSTSYSVLIVAFFLLLPWLDGLDRGDGRLHGLSGGPRPPFFRRGRIACH